MPRHLPLAGKYGVDFYKRRLAFFALSFLHSLSVLFTTLPYPNEISIFDSFVRFVGYSRLC
jgi:hypothetical protein